MAPLIAVLLVMLAIGGVYAEDIDVDSSDVAESPISAELDTGLSSSDAFNSQLTDIDEPLCSVQGNEKLAREDNCGDLNATLIDADSHDFNAHDQDVHDCRILKSPKVDSAEISHSDNMVKFITDDAFQLISESDILRGDESVFEDTLKESGYISKVEEVYRGLLSGEDNKRLLRSAVYNKSLIFAEMAYWYNETVKLEILQKIANQEQGYEGLFDVNTLTKALLKYDSLEQEWWIYKFVSEDEQSQVINGTDSHDLDYVYDKHVNASEDMHNLVVLTPYGIVFIEEQTSLEPWDGLNDILDGISDKTLLPDHQAKWTPLLLLKQQDSEKSDEDSHSDDDDEKKSGNKRHDSDKKQSDTEDKTHFKGENDYDRYFSRNYVPVNAVLVPALNMLDDSTNSSSDNGTNSTNVTASGNQKAIESVKPNQNAGPTYTWVYAIIGIVIVGFLFNTGYMKRDD